MLIPGVFSYKDEYCVDYLRTWTRNGRALFHFPVHMLLGIHLMTRLRKIIASHAPCNRLGHILQYAKSSYRLIRVKSERDTKSLAAINTSGRPLLMDKNDIQT